MFSKNGKVMLVIIGAIAVGAFVFGSAPAALLQVGLLALCPLMMLFMHGGHGGHGDHGGNEKATGAGTTSIADADKQNSATHQHH